MSVNYRIVPTENPARKLDSSRTEEITADQTVRIKRKHSGNDSSDKAANHG